MIDLKAEFGTDFKVTLDESAEILGQTNEDRLWLYQIPGKKGHVFIQGESTLGAYVKTSHDSTDRLGRLLALPGASLHQRGDHEASVTFPPDQISQVSQILQLKTRRRLSPEQKAKLAETLAPYRFSPAVKPLV